MTIEKYGFIYIWRDKKHKRYYVGSHWGTEDDGYICSSTWMRNSYKRRSEDFKRRILSFIYTNRKDLLKEEQRFLDMIKPKEVKIRYYNLLTSAGQRWHTDPQTRHTIGQKVSAAKLGKSNGKHTEETKKKIAVTKRKNLDKKFAELGYFNSPEHIEKMRQKKIGTTHTQEHKKNIGFSSKSWWDSPAGLLHKQKRRIAFTQNNPNKKTIVAMR